MTTTNAISSSNITQLIAQANLVLSDQEQSTISSQLNEALSAISVLNELDTSTVSSVTSASGLTNVMREDVVKPSFTQNDALGNANQTHNGYFMVQAVFENQDN